jgi:hypothetical protein
MFAKTAIALAAIVVIASSAQATPRHSSTIPTLDEFDCEGDDVGSTPRILINRPKIVTCDSVR